MIDAANDLLNFRTNARLEREILIVIVTQAKTAELIPAPSVQIRLIR